MGVKLFLLLLISGYSALSQISDPHAVFLDNLSSDVCNCYSGLMDSLDPPLRKLLIDGLENKDAAQKEFQLYFNTLDSLQKQNIKKQINDNFISKNSKFERCVLAVANRYEKRYPNTSGSFSNPEHVTYMEEKMQQMGDCRYFYKMFKQGITSKRK